MDENTKTHLDNLWSPDKDIQNKAFFSVLEITDQPVDWAYDVWDTLVAHLKHKDNHYRAIAAQVLCNLAKSDPQNRMNNDFDTLIAVTKDERFVTARHCLQALWKIGTVGETQRQKLVAGLSARFQECINEKNCTLIRYDIIEGLRRLYDAVEDKKVQETALALIDSETDDKYRKKYAGVWKQKKGI